MSSFPETVKEQDIPVVAPGLGDRVRGLQAGVSCSFRIGGAGGIALLDSEGEIPAPAGLEQRVDVLEQGQGASLVGFATRTAMNSSLAYPDGTLALVTNDSTSANNTTYRKAGASGAGSWVQSADRVSAVSTAAFQWRGNVPEGLIAATRTHGIYQLVANGAYSDRPSGLAASKAAILVVHEMSVAGGRFQLHELRDPDNPALCWVRRVDQNNQSAYAWNFVPSSIPDLAVTSAKLAAGAVTGDKLGSAYNSRGNVAAGDAAAIIAAGFYLVSRSTVTGLPEDALADGFMKVEVSGTWVFQEYRTYNDAAIAWRRTLRTSPSQVYPWRRINPAGTLPYVGKKFAFLGDSMTEFGDYPARVGTRLGVVPVKLGFGGCRMGAHVGTTNSPLYDKMSMYRIADYIASGNYTDLLQAADDLYAAVGDDNRAQALLLSQTDWSSVECMVIYFGANDFTGGVPLGTASSADGSTLRGSINHIVSTILAAYPGVRILFVTPLWRSFASLGAGMDADTWSNVLGSRLVDYVDAIIEQAAINHIPCLDLFRNGGVNKYNAAHWLADEAHPKPGHGYQLLADKIGAYISAEM